MKTMNELVADDVFNNGLDVGDWHNPLPEIILPREGFIRFKRNSPTQGDSQVRVVTRDGFFTFANNYKKTFVVGPVTDEIYGQAFGELSGKRFIYCELDKDLDREVLRYTMEREVKAATAAGATA